MSTISPISSGSRAAEERARRTRLNKVDVRGNRALKWVAVAATVVTLVVLIYFVLKILQNASLAFNRWGLGFITSTSWNAKSGEFGGWPAIYGTIMTAVSSLILATVLGLSIGLFLALMAPKGVSLIVGPLVELLVAVPSAIVGLIGIVVLVPFFRSTLMPWLHSVLGFIPLFGPMNTAGNSLFCASMVLTIMIVPIIAALSRDVFQTVPRELMDGAEALGATRWEVIRGVVLPTTIGGTASACAIGFGRAIGEAIAVSQVIGGDYFAHINQFLPGASIGSVLASQVESSNGYELSALWYLSAILLVFSILTNLAASAIRTRDGGSARPSLRTRIVMAGRA